MARQVWGKRTQVKLLGGSFYVNAPSGVTQIKERATTISTRARNLKPMLDDFADYMIKKRIPKQFAIEGLPRRWKPLRPSTIAEKRRLGFGSKGILERTGRLKAGFRAVTTARTMQIVNRVTVNGKNLADIHQNGTARIPARPMIVMGKPERAMLSNMIRDYFED